MSQTLLSLYERLILKKPVLTLLVLALVVTFFGYQAKNLTLDASADSLVLENDESLRFYRSISARYGSEDFLVITYTPKADLLSDAVLADLRKLRDSLLQIERVNSVVTLLDVPLISSPPMTIDEISENGIRTLESPETVRDLAREEFVNSPLYRNLLISPDGKTTAIQVKFRYDETYHSLLQQRNDLRAKQIETALTTEESAKLEAVSAEFREYSDSIRTQEANDIARVREIMSGHNQNAQLFLGGVPMIVADSIEFVRNDLKVFGIGVLVFMLLILFVAFRKPRWVILPVITCAAASTVMIGLLGFLDWRITVVSSNFVSLMLIMTLSLTVHLIVRYREYHADEPDSDQLTLVKKTVAIKTIPCFYTAITTMVAFGSLLVSGIRPVIDFGWMMVIGMTISFVIAFTLLPAALMLLKPGNASTQRDITGKITRFFAHVIQKFTKPFAIGVTAIAVLAVIGMTSLSVENRFIDYYKKTTEIYQGMSLIDHKLGGTTPLDVIIDAPADFFEKDNTTQDSLSDAAMLEAFEGEDAELFAQFEDETDTSDGGLTATSYWYNRFMLKKIAAIHDYIDSLPESGKVLSLHSGMALLQQLNKGNEMDDLFLALLYERLPQDLKSTLFTPYMSEDGNQLRFSIRVFESDANLRRSELLDKIRTQLTTEFALKPEQVHLTGMVVLYNNMLQSLFRSQILTIGVVIFAIFAMFVVLFRSIKIAAIAIFPNALSVFAVLSIMGWLRIPLDMMTITIAAISIGIAVDNTIHYINRFQDEFPKDRAYWPTIFRCHSSIGLAMYYTSVTITLGFAILALSNFVPTIYFGLLTGFAMVVALLANLTLLPLLMAWLKPLGTEKA